jgi:hypothetical protein
MTRHARASAARLTPLTWAAATLAIVLGIIGWLAGSDGRSAPLVVAAIIGTLAVVLAHDDCARARARR